MPRDLAQIPCCNPDAKITRVNLAVLPGAGLLSLTWLIGAFALIFGVAFIVLGFRVRTLGAGSRVS